MYVSDYGFAASPTNWTTNLSNYNNDTNIISNWLFLGINDWTISPIIENLTGVFEIGALGNIIINQAGHFSYGRGSVRPTFYLNSDVRFVDGTGTETDPYRIA